MLHMHMYKRFKGYYTYIGKYMYITNAASVNPPDKLQIGWN